MAPLPAQLAAGGETTFKLQLHSLTPRSIAGEVSLPSDDADEAPFTFTVSGTVTTGVIEAYVTAIQLAVDNGLLPDDLITSDPRLAITVDGIFSGNAKLEFDLNNDNTADGEEVLLVPGETVTYDPRTNDPLLNNFVGSVTVRYRTVFTGGSEPAAGPWEPFTFTLELPRVPEIILRDIAAQELVSGAAQIEFGVTYLNEPVSRSFTIENSGTADLSLDVANISLPTGFSMSSFPTTTVAPGGSTSFTVDLTGDWPGDYHGTLVIPNNDADEGAYSLSLFGKVLVRQPELDVRLSNSRPLIAGGTNTIEFGITAVGTPLTQSVTITNLGNCDLIILSTSEVTGSDFILTTPLPPVLLAGGSITIGIQLAALQTGTNLDAHFNLLTNDPDEGNLQVNLRGSVITPVSPATIEITQLGVALLHDTGESPTDFVTYDARLVGDRDFTGTLNGQIIVDFDHDNNGIMDGSTTVTVSGNAGTFAYDPREADPLWHTAAGNLPLRYRWRTVNPAGTTVDIATSWTSFPLTLETPPWINDLHVAEVGLLRDSGDVTNDLITTDPSVWVYVAGQLDAPQFALQFDYDGNEVVDGEVVTDTSPGELEYDPRVSDPTWRAVSENTQRELRYRLQTRDAAGAILITAGWQTFSFEQVPLPSSQLFVSNLRLAIDTGNTADRISSNPTVTGGISGTRSEIAGSYIRSAAVVELDLNNDTSSVEGVATVSNDQFIWLPSFAYYGTQIVQARVKEWSPVYGDYLYGSWSTLPANQGSTGALEFSYVAPNSPSLTEFKLTATTSTTSDPTVQGKLVSGPNVAYVTIAFYYDGSSVAAGYRWSPAPSRRSASPATSRSIRC